MDTKEKTAEEKLTDFVQKETEYLKSVNRINALGNIVDNDFADGIICGMNRVLSEYTQQKLSALQSSPDKEVEKPESTSFKDFLIKRVGKENYIKHFPNHYSEIEIIYTVNDYVSPLQSRVKELEAEKRGIEEEGYGKTEL